MANETTGPDRDLLIHTVEIVSAHLIKNSVATADVPALIQQVYGSLSKLGAAPAPEPVEEQKPAVSIRKSVTPDYLVCLEDGRKLKMMKRYLRTAYGMSPDEYRTKWGLPSDYPMTAPAYATKRKELAHRIGLGRKASVSNEHVD
jgi:predicted transcriptional regulator